MTLLEKTLVIISGAVLLYLATMIDSSCWRLVGRQWDMWCY